MWLAVMGMGTPLSMMLAGSPRPFAAIIAARIGVKRNRLKEIVRRKANGKSLRLLRNTTRTIVQFASPWQTLQA